jgi:hypothetical protein
MEGFASCSQALGVFTTEPHFLKVAVFGPIAPPPHYSTSYFVRRRCLRRGSTILRTQSGERAAGGGALAMKRWQKTRQGLGGTAERVAHDLNFE